MRLLRGEIVVALVILAGGLLLAQTSAFSSDIGLVALVLVAIGAIALMAIYAGRR